jgi:hypothetical protein
MTAVRLPWIAPSHAATPLREFPRLSWATAARATRWPGASPAPFTQATAVLNPIRHNVPGWVIGPPRARR